MIPKDINNTVLWIVSTAIEPFNWSIFLWPFSYSFCYFICTVCSLKRETSLIRKDIVKIADAIKFKKKREQKEFYMPMHRGWLDLIKSKLTRKMGWVAQKVVILRVRTFWMLSVAVMTFFMNDLYSNLNETTWKYWEVKPLATNVPHHVEPSQ